MSQPRLLVTGAAGFTGKYLLEAAKTLGYRCVGLIQNPDDKTAFADETVAADLLNPPELEQAIMRCQPDYIAHLAAITFVGHGNISDFYKVNQLGTVNLLDAISKHAPDVKNILIASSANIYGNAKAMPITETTQPTPVNHYSMSKLTMEMAAQLYAHLPIVIIRPFNYTGFDQNENFLVPKIVSAYRQGKKEIELGNLDVARDFSDVRDVVTAYLRLLDSTNLPYNVFNICSGVPTSLMDIVTQMNEMAGYKIKVKINPDFVRSDEIKTLYGTPARLASAIGAFREYSFPETLEWMFTEQL